MLLMFLSCPTWAHSYGNKKYCIVLYNIILPFWMNSSTEFISMPQQTNFLFMHIDFLGGPENLLLKYIVSVMKSEISPC